jgi:hypothetical protein
MQFGLTFIHDSAIYENRLKVVADIVGTKTLARLDRAWRPACALTLHILFGDCKACQPLTVPSPARMIGIRTLLSCVSELYEVILREQ